MAFIDVRIHQNMGIQELHLPYQTPYRSPAEGSHLRRQDKHHRLTFRPNVIAPRHSTYS